MMIVRGVLFEMDRAAGVDPFHIFVFNKVVLLQAFEVKENRLFGKREPLGNVLRSLVVF